MDNQKQVEILKENIENMAGKKMHGPKDFDNLSAQIFNRLKIMISPTTLKRLWGYLNEGGNSAGVNTFHPVAVCRIQRLERLLCKFMQRNSAVKPHNLEETFDIFTEQR